MLEAIRKPVPTRISKSTLKVGERGTDGRRFYAARVLNISTINNTPHVSVPVTNVASYTAQILHTGLNWFYHQAIGIRSNTIVWVFETVAKGIVQTNNPNLLAA